MMQKQQHSARFYVLKPASLAMLSLLLLLVAGPARSADLFKGKEVFSNYCVSCHGADGVAVHPMAPNFQRGEKLFVSDLSLIQSISRGKGAMPSFGGILSDKEIMDVIAYLRTLTR
jgi:cytochrome c6